MSKLETNMAALSRYIELKYKDYNGIAEDEYFFIYRLGMLPKYADTVAFLVLLEYIRDNGIDEYIEGLYDEPFEYWTYAPVIRSYRSELRLKGSLWYSHYERIGMVVIEKEFEELVRMFSPLSSYVNKYVRLELNFFEVAEVLLRSPVHREYRDQGLENNDIKKLSLDDLEKAARCLSKGGGIEVLVKSIDK